MTLFLGFKFDSVYFASRGESCAAPILPLVEHDWLKWPHDEYDITEKFSCWVKLRRI